MFKKIYNFLLLFLLMGLFTVPFFTLVPDLSAQSYATTTENVTVSVTILGAGVCGNGLVDNPAEECDDGNFISGDGCSDTCIIEFCGDGTIQTLLGEECDDGNNIDDDGCDSNCLNEGPEPPPEPDSGYSGVKPKTGQVQFNGMTSPFAFVTVYRDGAISATEQADAYGNFSINMLAQETGVHTFGFSAEDSYKGDSLTYQFSISIVPRRITKVDNIVIPPTIYLERSETFRGRDIVAFGETVPNSLLNLLIYPDNIIQTNSNSLGYWQNSIKTNDLAIGQQTVKAQTTIPTGYQSPYSANISFEVLPSIEPNTCNGPDLNYDGQVDIFDLSLLLYDWEEQEPSLVCSDINVDSNVNLIDFSIMLFWWTR